MKTRKWGPILAIAVLTSLLFAGPVAAAAPSDPDTPGDSRDSAATRSPRTALSYDIIIDDRAPVEIRTEQEPLVPQTFAVSDSMIYIQDQTNDTIRIYRDGVFQRSVKTAQLHPADLLAIDGRLLMLDIDGNIQHLRLDDAGLRQTGMDTRVAGKRRALTKSVTMDIAPKRLGLADDQLVIQFEDGSLRAVGKSASELAPTPVTEMANVDSNPDGFTIGGGIGSAKTIVLPFTPINVEWIASDSHHEYFKATSSYDNTAGTTTYISFIYEFDQESGALIHTFTMLPSDSPSASREIQVDHSRVYQLRTLGAHAQVLLLHPDSNDPRIGVDNVAPSSVPEQTNAPAVSQAKNSVSGTGITAAAASTDPPKVTEEDVFGWAYAMAGRRWTYTKATNGNKGEIKSGKDTIRKAVPSGVRQPRYLAAVSAAAATVTGVPYAWGRDDPISGMQIHSKKAIPTFESRIKASAYAGNTTKAVGTVDATAGVDCSGFVTRVFEIGEKIDSSTLIGSRYFSRLDSIKKRTPGDIIAHTGHVVIYLGDAKAGYYTIAESTNTSEKNDRVVITDRPASDFSTWSWGHYKSLVNSFG